MRDRNYYGFVKGRFGDLADQKMEEFMTKGRMKKSDKKNLAILTAVWEKGVVYAVKKEKVSEDFVWYLLLAYCGSRLYEFLGRKGAVMELLLDALKRSNK